MHRFIRSAAFVLALAVPVLAAADYPTHAVKVVSPYPPGGTVDILSRIISGWLQEKLGQPFVVENKAGGGNNIGTEYVIKSAPDGYTMLLVNPANGINATLYKNLPFNLVRDLAPVAGLIRVPNVMEVTVSFPAKTVAEFIAYCKANPGKINMASSGSGTSVHLSGELFKSMTGCNMLHVPYKGSGPVFADLIPGVVHVMFDNLPASIGYIRGGKLRALAVTSAERSPREAIDKINAAVNAALADPGMLKRFTELGGKPMGGTPEDFGKVIVAETAKWEKVVVASGAKAE